jgi:hypothetical protein
VTKAMDKTHTRMRTMSGKRFIKKKHPRKV